MKVVLTAICFFFVCGHILAANTFPKLPAQGAIQYITADEPRPNTSDTYFVKSMVKPSDVRRILRSYHQVSRHDWLNHYSHVADGDRYGWIILKGGAKIRWMVRPGGLATLTYSDGRTAYLALGKNV